MNSKTMNEEEKQYIRNMANYIWKIIKSGGPVCWSWGISAPMATQHENMPALRFNVNGFKFQGCIYVAYNGGNDLFEIFLRNRQGHEQHIKEVFIEDLIPLLNRHIETENDQSEDYKKKVEIFLNAK